MIRLLASSVAAAALLWTLGASAQMSHNHGAHQPSCTDPGLACATKVTPAFAPDGSLWVAWAAGGRVSVARSPDLGRSFVPAVAVNREPLRLDSGPDERPKLAIDRSGRIAVAYAIFKDSAFNGQVLHSHSTDGGKTFAPSRPITRARASLLRGAATSLGQCRGDQQETFHATRRQISELRPVPLADLLRMAMGR